MISLTKRQMDILKQLLGQADYINVKQLAELYEVSERTIRYDLDFIESFLKEYDVTLIRKPGKGIYLEISPEKTSRIINELLQLNHYVVTKKDLIYMLSIQILLEQNTTLESLGETFQISKNRVFQYMENVEELFNQYGVKVEKKPSRGISPVGNELDIRNAFASLFNEAITLSALSKQYIFQQFDEELLHLSKRFTKDFENHLSIQFSDDSLDELYLILCFQHTRLQRGYIADYPFVEKKEFLKTKDFQQLKEIYQSIFHITLEDDEVVYLLKQVKGAKVSVYPIGDVPFSKQEDAYQITYLFATEVEKRLGINFKQDLEFMNGLMVHLQVALHRLFNHQKIENPLTEQVKYKYRFIFEITRKALLKIEELYHFQLPEEEIAYIAMHLGASYERHSFSGYMPTALVVCGSGLATSSLLATRLKIMLPELKAFGPISMSNLDQYMDQEFDFIISTVPLTIKDYEVVVVNPLLEPEELMTLKKLVFKKTYQKQMDELIRTELPLKDYHELGDLIPMNHIQLHGDVDSWRNAIRLASQSLIENGFITNQYTHAMIRAVEELGPYMVFIPEVAIVHASSKEGVLKDGASLLALDKPIPFGDSEKVMVQLIFVICSTMSESDLFIQLVQILEENNNLEILKSSKRIQEILKLNNETAR
ncbi:MULTISPECIES: BglG family transcription antiterminator [Heyndrickxia]|uniref:Uncharacterized protein n=1 Tax=Heyndrickxia sporothermodurans TaxID=46224 RepID=A0A150LHI6_9BACI|nr:BglG family transcription antiterminator [Heyndrickxia sporothermodurans]KYD11704.1 hypothetical protein B4102_2090 [Heyndrickxia sporothermodurans]MED3780143.1 BglG family transcription antiterminator [Heyndrickxia sporothermodurans]PTY76062.1 hypothetical protein B5V89_19200 [Heyndrickxia sporothermodurans]